MFSFLIVMVLGLASLYSHPAQKHEDVYVGQPTEMKGVVFGKEWFEFSFRPENRMEILAALERTFREVVSPIVGDDPMVFLTCYINGINVPRHEFDDGMQKIDAQLKGRTPLIGLYNATRGFISDAQRLFLEKKGVATVSRVSLQNFLGTAFEHLSRLNPRGLILMLAHSEGGLLLEQAIEGLGEWGREMANKHLLIRTFGSVQAVAKDMAKDVLNVYSNSDHAAFGFVKEKFHLISHSFRFYQPHGAKSDNDHAFLDQTYQRALADQVSAIFDQYPGIAKVRSR